MSDVYRVTYVSFIYRLRRYYFPREVLPWACLYVCPLAYLKNHTSKFTIFSVGLHVICGRDGSVLLWRQCNMLCTFGLVDDVTFAHNRADRGDANRTYTKSDSPAGRTGGEVWCRRLTSGMVHVAYIHKLATRLAKKPIFVTNCIVFF